jgi:predicted nucleic acid binding AN1-type Zn finger protein
MKLPFRCSYLSRVESTSKIKNYLYRIQFNLQHIEYSALQVKQPPRVESKVSKERVLFSVSHSRVISTLVTMMMMMILEFE